MTLNSALNVGRSAISVAQTALQVTGNNMANAATEGFHRRSVHLAPVAGDPTGHGQFVGGGVQMLAIRREVDVALQGRFRDAVSQEHAALIDQRFLTALETIQNELTDNDLSSLLSTFFNSFSELANNPEDVGIRSVVIEEGQAVAGRISTIRQDYEVTRSEVDTALGAAVSRANELLDQIEGVTSRIAEAEGGAGREHALRDHRDLLIDELAQLLDVTALEHPNGSVDLLVGSTPIMSAGLSRGIELRHEPVGAATDVTIRVRDDGTTLGVDTGEIGGLLRTRATTIDAAIAALDTFASQLIFQVNRVHSQGQGQSGFTSLEGTTDINDSTANLNSLAAAAPYRVENGSFFIHVTHTDTGERTTHQISVDGDAMSLDDLVNEINVTVGVPNLTAGTGTANHLTLDADVGYEVSFSDDSSGALAALGLNTFFAGEDASTITVNDVLLGDPRKLAAGADHLPGSNGTALALADLPDQAFTDLNGVSLRDFWLGQVASLAGRTAAAHDAVSSAQLVRESLSAQNQALSGVSLDDEAINLLSFQRQFQAAARYLSVIDETLQELLSIV